MPGAASPVRALPRMLASPLRGQWKTTRPPLGAAARQYSSKRSRPSPPVDQPLAQCATVPMRGAEAWVAGQYRAATLLVWGCEPQVGVLTERSSRSSGCLSAARKHARSATTPCGTAPWKPPPGACAMSVVPATSAGEVSTSSTALRSCCQSAIAAARLAGEPAP